MGRRERREKNEAAAEEVTSAAGAVVDDNADARELAKVLASNEKKVRDKAMRALRRWIQGSCAASKDGIMDDLELMKTWKGLFYCMWMADKVPTQQALARDIAKLGDCFPSLKASFKSLSCFFRTMRREWEGLDHLRIDKFYSLIRFTVHEYFQMTKEAGWNGDDLEEMMRIVKEEVFFSKPDGLRYHVAQLLIEELNKVDRNVSTDTMQRVLRPAYACFTEQGGLSKDFAIRFILEPFVVMNFDDEEGPAFPSVNFKAIESTVFAIAADVPMSPQDRDALYEIHAELKRIAKLQRKRSPQVAAESFSIFEIKVSSDQSVAKSKKKKSPKNGGKREKKSQKKSPSLPAAATNAETEAKAETAATKRGKKRSAASRSSSSKASAKNSSGEASPSKHVRFSRRLNKSTTKRAITQHMRETSLPRSSTLSPTSKGILKSKPSKPSASSSTRKKAKKR